MNEIETAARLAAGGVENAANEARWLHEKFGDIPAATVEKRLSGYPLQYLLGEWDFYKETYEVDENCLIPRADTELLVETAVKLLPPSARFIDLCTGSGCVAVSTLAARRDAAALATDLFPQTLALAKRNAARNGVAERVRFYLSDVFTPPAGELSAALEEGKLSAVLSNPPYIKEAVMPTLSKEVGYEPRAALCGGVDGLDFYRAILEYWRPHLAPDGFFLFEIGYDQAEDLAALAAAHGLTFSCLKDLCGNDRVVCLRQK